MIGRGVGIERTEQGRTGGKGRHCRRTRQRRRLPEAGAGRRGLRATDGFSGLFGLGKDLSFLVVSNSIRPAHVEVGLIESEHTADAPLTCFSSSVMALHWFPISLATCAKDF